MSSEPSSHDRRLELLAERALFGITQENQHELVRLGGDDSPVDDMALAAAALDLGLHGHAMAHEAMPAAARPSMSSAGRSTRSADSWERAYPNSSSI